MQQEVNMKFKEKLLILIIAFVVSVLGFNLIASSSVCLLQTAKEAGYDALKNYRPKCDADIYRTQRINGIISQFDLQGKKNGC